MTDKSTVSASTAIIRKLKADVKEGKDKVSLKKPPATLPEISGALVQQVAQQLTRMTPPAALSNYLTRSASKPKSSDGEASYDPAAINRDADRKRALNNKLMNALFLSSIDTDEIRAVLEHSSLGDEHAPSQHANPHENLRKTFYEMEVTDPKIVDSSIDMSTDLTDHEKDAYFGQLARVDFFDKYRQMANAKLKISAASSIFQSSPSRDDAETATLGPTVVSQLEDEDDDDENASDGEFQSLTSSHHTFTRPGEIDSSSSSTFISSSMGRRCQDFYGELQRVVSSEELNKSIDSSLLAFDSFHNYRLKFDGSKSSNIIHQAPRKRKKQKGKRRAIPRDSRPIRLPPLSLSPPKKHHESSGFEDVVSVSSVISTLSSAAAAQSSPRTVYLSGCLRDGLLPMPNLILRKNYTKVINLAHAGMGDKMGRVLAECLQSLPLIESVNLNDNDLTDDSLKYLIDAIVNIKGLTSLDLSRNKIDGESSDSLAEYVSRADCPLLVLTLQSADVDDGECDRFVQCLVSNRKLRELDLSANLLGTVESKGDPTAKSGPESIANYLKSTMCRLEVLKVAWNSIRMRSAKVLASSLAFNSTVTYLDMSCNGLGWAAGEALGDALMENRTLRTLVASNNNFSSSSIMCICVGIVENTAIKHVNLNENPIGIAGARAILQLSMVVGSRVTVSAANCNTIVMDERCWYDPDQPCKEYCLELNQPFDRAVAFHLMQTVANHSTYTFEYATIEESAGRASSLQLEQIVLSDREKTFDAEQRHVLSGLKRMRDAASNLELGTQLFHEADADGSGKLDKDELREVLAQIGFDIDEDRLHDIFTVFDVDGEGAIDKAEFMSLLKSQRHDAIIRINDLLNYPVMAVNKQRYIPPRKGTLRLKVKDGFVRKKTFYTLSSLDTKYAYSMAKGIGDVTMMTDATKNSKTRFNEALNIYKTMYKEMGDKAAVLIKVVPGMMHPAEARQLISKVTSDERLEIARIKMAFGVAYRPMLGGFDGYYMLDLSKDLHRICLSRLLEQSQTMNFKRKSSSIIGFGKVGDTSQHGNWTAFRNEIFNGELIEVTPALFTPIPHSGILEFDFSGGNRPIGGELVLSDMRLTKVLRNINLLYSGPAKKAKKDQDGLVASAQWVLKKLAVWKKKAKAKSLDGKSPVPMYAANISKALEIGLASDDFYDNLKSRAELFRKGLRGEEVKYDFMNDDGGGSDVDGDAPIGALGSVAASAGTSFSTIGDRSTAESSQEGGGDGGGGDDESMASSQDSADAHRGDQLALRQRKIAELKHRYHKLLHFNKGIPVEAKAARFCDLIEETFSQLWILSRHLAVIVVLFKELFGECGRSEFYGSYVVDVVVLLFARVVDLHNFEVVLGELSAVEVAVVYGRIGILNVFNPLKPEQSMELSLERRDERVVSKMIVSLISNEPGINLVYKRFQWKRDMDPTPGWDVTETWLTDDGLATHGKFAFTFYSGEGGNKSGYAPNILLRRALLQVVLIDENEVVDEDEPLPDEYMNSGAIHYEQSKDVWLSLLIGNGRK